MNIKLLIIAGIIALFTVLIIHFVAKSFHRFKKHVEKLQVEKYQKDINNNKNLHHYHTMMLKVADKIEQWCSKVNHNAYQLNMHTLKRHIKPQMLNVVYDNPINHVFFRYEFNQGHFKQTNKLFKRWNIKV